MTQDFVQRLLQVLGDSPRNTWEARVRAEFGGNRHYIAQRSPPQDSDLIRELRDMGIPSRTARYKVRGR